MLYVDNLGSRLQAEIRGGEAGTVTELRILNAIGIELILRRKQPDNDSSGSSEDEGDRPRQPTAATTPQAPEVVPAVVVVPQAAVMQREDDNVEKMRQAKQAR